ncbi:hypothetical protein [Aestuariimicrobium ganziense]|nr:hypothetical protein [Aestuariimicrobium ganziense]
MDAILAWQVSERRSGSVFGDQPPNTMASVSNDARLVSALW